MSDDRNKTPQAADNGETLLEFPCNFDLKVFVKPEVGVDQQILELLEPHIGKIPLSACQRKVSRTGKYVSLTVNYVATSKKQVDAVYAELGNCPLVVMAM